MSLLQQRKAEPIDYWPDRRKRRRSPVGAAAGRARFDFGSNWSRFLAQLDGPRIAEAETSLKHMLETETLAGLKFLDIGSGSGIFSLSARRLGASVRSFDYDRQSVACTGELQRRYFPQDEKSLVEAGSVLDDLYMRSLGKFDVVYAWGVLHHTGQMWRALENAQRAVALRGKLFVAIYNDMGSRSARWKRIKKTYNELPAFLRPAYALIISAPGEAKSLLSAMLSLEPASYAHSWTQYGLNNRGMSRWRDIVDWVGGYPYEFAKPEEILDFCRARGFSLVKLKCGGVGLGCNEFVFLRDAEHP